MERLGFIGEEESDVGKAGLEDGHPFTAGVVAGIERSGPAGGDGMGQGFGSGAAHVGQGEDIGQMKMSGGFGEDSGIGEDGLADAGGMEEGAGSIGGDENDGGRGWLGQAVDLVGVDAGLAEAGEDAVSKIVAADGASEVDGDSEGRESERGVGAVAAEVLFDGIDPNGVAVFDFLDRADEDVLDQVSGDDDGAFDSQLKMIN